MSSIESEQVYLLCNDVLKVFSYIYPNFMNSNFVLFSYEAWFVDDDTYLYGGSLNECIHKKIIHMGYGNE